MPTGRVVELPDLVPPALLNWCRGTGCGQQPLPSPARPGSSGHLCAPSAPKEAFNAEKLLSFLHCRDLPLHPLAGRTHRGGAGSLVGRRGGAG